MSESYQELLRQADALVYVADLDHPALERSDAHHLREVLRLRGGATVVAADGNGTFRLCRLGALPTRTSRRTRPVDAGDDIDGLEVDGQILHIAQHPSVTVGFAMVKGDRNEWIVQKLTELGVDRIAPYFARRSVVRLDGAGRAQRALRLRRIAREAGAQSRRPTLPEIDEPTELGDLLGTFEAPAMAHFGGASLSASVRCVLIGPEGGWTDEELGLALKTVDLGPTVLRAETAAVAAGVQLTAWRDGRR